MTNFTGSNGNDTFAGTDGPDILSGQGGDDTLSGGDSDDILSGGDGDDFLVGGQGADTLDGDDGYDTLFGGDGADILRGGAGDDTLNANGGVDYRSDTGDLLIGGDGNDRLNGGRAAGVSFDGGDGNDTIFSATIGTALGGDGDDIIITSGAQPVAQPTLIDGGAGFDELKFSWFGWSDQDIDMSKVVNFEKITVGDRVTLSDVNTLAGQTLIVVGEGANYGIRIDGSAELDGHLDITGGNGGYGYPGNDVLTGGQQSDIIRGLDGNDLLKGGAGDDTIDGGLGNDTAVFSGNMANYSVVYDNVNGLLIVTDTVGGDGSDTLSGVNRLQFADQTIDVVVPGLTLTGTPTVDVLAGGEGNDTVAGLAGNDTLDGLLGDDILSGGDGDDFLVGGQGADTLDGDDGYDTLFGGDGADILRGGAGDDTLNANGGVDYRSDTGDVLIGGDGNDRLNGGRAAGVSFDGGDGNDTIFSATIGTALGGDGDDIIITSGAQPVAQPTLIDGGAGFDELKFSWFGWSDQDIDMSKVVNFEKITVGDRVTLSDVNTLAGQTLIVVGEGANYGIRIDGSAELDGHLDITGGNGGYGYPGNDVLTGGQQSDIIRGLDGNDLLKGGAGDDTIDGGLGNDTAVFSGNMANYSVVYDNVNGLLIVTDTVGGDGSDTLSGVNRLQFADQTIDVVVPGLTLNGTPTVDVLAGGEGNDTVAGLAGNDTLDGLLGDDILSGGDGDDFLVGGQGADTLDGDDGYDTLFGGDGADILRGGAGDDTLNANGGVDYRSDTGDVLIGGDGNDRLNGGRAAGVSFDGGDGNDTIFSATIGTALGGDGDDIIITSGAQPVAQPTLIDGGVGFDELKFSWFGWSDQDIDMSKVVNFEKITVGDRVTLSDVNTLAGQTLIVVGEGANYGIRIDGSAELDGHLDITGGNGGYGYPGNDVLTGGKQSDIIRGLDGNDLLKGGAGDDTIDGGLGNDTAVFSGNRAAYTITDYHDGTLKVVGNDGTDQLRSVRWLRFDDQTLEFIPPGIVLNGSTGNDNLVGTDDNDSLIGLAGNDTLNGGLGGDRMVGGLGNDTYYVDSSGDSIHEANNQGIDTVISSITFYLAGLYVENLTLTGSGNINGYGNGLGNVLIGNDGSNTLNGGLGVDTMIGGGGNDLYYVETVGDVTVENANEGNKDAVYAYINYTLGNNIEILALSGYQAINGTGNSLDNTLTGNGNVNVLNGGDGKDLLIGQGGNDVLTGGNGLDSFRFSHAGSANGLDHLTDFASGTDKLQFVGSDYGFAAGHVLTVAEFHSGGAVGAGTQFLYNAVNHTLYWDSDGAGGLAPIGVAVFDNAAAIRATDFVFL